MGRILFINIDALELVETKDNLEMNLCLHRSAQKSVKISSHVSNSSRQFNNSNIYPHRSLNDLTEIVSSSVSKSSSSTSSASSSSSSSTYDYLHNDTLQNDFRNSSKQCPHCAVELNTSKLYPLHYESLNSKTNNNNINKSHDSFKLPVCSCHYFKQISSPLSARQLLIELKQREFKQKIIEQWKIVGIVLDRIFFILYFITILLSALLFHPTLIDDYNDD
ncbi:unnamed protein product [Schistosoma mattheei]|uniref:Uncharacterized protein n=1 Tax=Schistosoma mattheei TaxID=31246 RepID=A0A183P4L8_9TREM|nr:unnamed protein product [Schistosoma mattheei]